MDYVNELSNLIMNNLQYVLLGMTVMIFLALMIFVNINIKLAKMNNNYSKMMKGMEGVNVEQMLLSHIDEVKQGLKRVDALTNQCAVMEERSKKFVQRVGIVRFNAFEDMGSDLSYAIALLDEYNNGVVISSIYSRNESHSYAKPIVSGTSTYYLTTEEMEALVQAIEKK